jgi:hypothetical protein
METFADIDGPVRIGLLALIGWIAVAVLAALILVSVVRLLIKKLGKSNGEAAIEERSPLEIALERLTRLQEEATEMEADPFIVEVSNIVRDYLETALEIPAREQTSEEVLQAVQLRGDMREILKAGMPQFLDQCDLVKFARQVLAGTQRSELLETAGTVVNETDASLLESISIEQKEVVAK